VTSATCVEHGVAFALINIETDEDITKVLLA